MNNKKMWPLIVVGLTAVSGSVYFYKSSNHSENNYNIIKEVTDIQSYSLKTLAEKIEYAKNDDSKVLRNQSFSDEFTFQQINNSILIPIEKKFISNDKNSFAGFFVNEAKIIGLDHHPSQLIDNRDGIKRYSWMTSPSLSLDQSELSTYMADFSKIEDFRIDITGYDIFMTDRAASDSSPKKMNLNGFLELRGISLNGERRHDSGRIQLSVVLHGNEWKIQQMGFRQFTTLVSNRNPGFKEITAQAFDQTGPSVHLRREAIRRGGYALSLTDVDKDGHLDFYVGSAKESEMWMYDTKSSKYVRRMQDVLANEKMVKTAIFNDFNNDKYEDLFITSFNPDRSAQGANEELVLYNNIKGTFHKVDSATSGFSKLNTYYPMPAVAGDFNNDGLSDIYVGFPGKSDFTFKNIQGHEVGGEFAVQGLFLNKSNLAFNVSKLSFPEMIEGGRQYLFPHSALAIDWNQDKNLDIVVIDDQDNLSPFYINKGNAQFEQVAEKIGIRDTSNAMSIAAADFNNDGLIDFAISSVNLNAAKRFEHSITYNWNDADGRSATGLAGNGVRLFQQTKNGTFIEMTEAAGLSYQGEGAAGLEFIDYNNDGLQDLYVTNGLWSGDDRYQDAGHFLVNHKVRANVTTTALLKDRVQSTMSPFMSMLVDFRGDLFAPDFKGNKSLSVGGYQRNRMFRNNGDGTFTDVGYMEGVDSINDGYVVATGDLNKDGKMDLVLRNGDPAQSNHQFPSVQVFENQMNWDGKSIELALKNNRGVDALGVGVTVEYAGNKQYKQMISNNGAAQSERILHFGIGNRDSVSKITVHWMSGDKVYKDFKAGRYELSEISSVLTQK